jgi:hypothetical protein
MKPLSFPTFPKILFCCSLALLVAGAMTSAKASPQAESKSALGFFEFEPPADAGWIDVRTLGAKGDGVTDNTPIFAAFSPESIHSVGTFYFPNGVYLFSDTFYLGNKRKILQGQSRDGTILRLMPKAGGFEDAATPKPFVSFHGRFMDSKSNMGQAFQNSVFNLTIEIGEGNPGAVALHYLNNNQGTVENVAIRSLDPEGKGRAGFGIVTNWPGPALVHGLTVEGFDFGIWSTISQYSMTFENIVLRGQREAGIRNAGQALFIRNLTSENKVPALINSVPTCNVVLVDSSLKGGAPDATAIESFQVERNHRWTFGRFAPGLFVRNVEVEGYGTSIVSRSGEGEVVVKERQIKEFSSHPAQRLGGRAQTSLALPWENPPPVDLGDPAKWVNAASFLGVNGDWTEALQGAIDSGAEVIYLPRGDYRATGTIHIRGNVRALLGMDATLSTRDWKDPEAPLFRIGPGAQDTILFHRLNDNYGQAPVRFEHAQNNTIIIRNSLISGYRNTVPGGTVHLLDVCGDRWDFRNQRVFARQCNTEWNARRRPEGFNIRVNGGSFLALGVKTEYGGTVLEATNGAVVEILGGWSYHDGGVGYINNRSRMSLAGISTAHGAFKEALVREIGPGGTRDIVAEVGRDEQNLDGAFTKYGTLMPLYIGW